MYNRCAPAQFVRVDKSSHISQKEAKHRDLKTELKRKKKKKNLPQIRIASEEESVLFITFIALKSMKLFASGQKLKPRGAERYCIIVKRCRWPICGCILARERMRAVPFDSTPR